MLEFEGQVIDTDAQGYLKNSADWHEGLAPLLAAQEEIVLTEAHWEVVRFVRDFYQEFNTSPAIRMLVKAMAQKYGEERQQPLSVSPVPEGRLNKPPRSPDCRNR